MARFAHALPDLREHVQADIDGDGFTRARVLACAVRLLDRGFFRIGSEEYTVENESFGLATMRKSHVTIGPDGAMEFDYPAKSGQRRVQAVVDKQAGEIVAGLKRRRAGGDDLLAFKDGRRWRDVRSEDINAYIKDATGDDFSAKDFRTWNATVLAAVALSVSGAVAGSATRRKRAISRAIKEVAHYLGNTPAVCRASYIDPRVFDAYNAGPRDRPPAARGGGGGAGRAADPPPRGRGGGARPDRRARALTGDRARRGLTLGATSRRAAAPAGRPAAARRAARPAWQAPRAPASARPG